MVVLPRPVAQAVVSSMHQEETNFAKPGGGLGQLTNLLLMKTLHAPNDLLELLRGVL